MKYIRKAATRRGLADIERLLDNYGWFILQELGATEPSNFVPVTTGDDINVYSTLSQIDDEKLATTAHWFFKVGSLYYKRIPQRMLAMVDTFMDDGGTLKTDKIFMYSPLPVEELGDFNEDFNMDFNITVVTNSYVWTELPSAPTGVTWTSENTASDLGEITPCVEHDYIYMKVGDKYYQKTQA